MAMGGGAGAAQSPTDRAAALLAANPNASRGELEAVANGMTPMSYSNFMNAKKLLLGDKKSGDPGAMSDVQKYGLQMRDLASGGLMLKGMNQLNKSFSEPSLGAGVMARSAARFGVQATPEQQMAMNDQSALSDAASKVSLSNQTRGGLSSAMRDMRFGGMGV